VPSNGHRVLKQLNIPKKLPIAIYWNPQGKIPSSYQPGSIWFYYYEVVMGKIKIREEKQEWRLKAEE